MNRTAASDTTPQVSGDGISKDAVKDTISESSCCECAAPGAPAESIALECGNTKESTGSVCVPTPPQVSPSIKPPLRMTDLLRPSTVFSTFGTEGKPGIIQEESPVPLRVSKIEFLAREHLCDSTSGEEMDLIMFHIDDYGCFQVNTSAERVGKALSFINTRFADKRLELHLDFCGFVARDPVIQVELSRMLNVRIIKHIKPHTDYDVAQVKRKLKRVVPPTGENGWVILDPGYEIPEMTRDVHARNAIRERMAAWGCERPTIVSNYAAAHKEFTLLREAVNAKHAASVLSKQSENYVVIDVVLKRYVLPPSKTDKPYEFAYDGEAIVSVTHVGKVIQVNTHHKYAVAGDSTRLMQAENLLRIANSVDFRRFAMPTVILVAGVPGCGKTKDIVDSHVRPSSDTRGDLVLSSSTENAQELRERSGAPDNKINYRTMHSYILHARGQERLYDTVYIDEALMAHAGEICLVACMSQCKLLILMGDPYQIPYINRMSNINLSRANIASFAQFSVKRSVSYRITARTAAMWEGVYGKGKILTTNANYERFKITPVVDISAITDKSRKALTFKQHEKTIMRRAGFDCSTIHEFQGKQTADICLWRSSVMTQETLYKSQPHMLVATTRHTKTFEYFTACSDDILCENIRRANYYTESQLRSYVVDVGSLHDLQPPLREILAHRSLRGGDVAAQEFNLPVGVEYREDWRWEPLVYDAPQYEGYVFASGLLPSIPERPVMYKPTPQAIHDMRVKMRTADARVEFVQDWYDRMLPGNSIHDLSYDNQIIHWGNFELTLDSAVIDLSKHAYPEPKYDCIRPVLRTSMPPVKPMSQLEMLRGFAGRNSNVPKVSGLRSIPDIIKDMTSSFCERCIDPNKRSLFFEYRMTPIVYSEELIAEWRENTASRAPTAADEFLGDTSLDFYEYLSKLKVKPDLTSAAPYKIGAPQMIACHGPNVNVFFAPIFREVKDRLLKVLHRKIHIFSDCTVQEYASTLSDQLGEVGERLEALELDIGKYDKSQDELALEWDCQVMQLFGVPEVIIGLWRNAHRSTTILDKRTGLKAQVPYQRKSGDAFTFMGNTIYLLGIFALIFPIQRLAALLIGGDDTLAIGRRVKRDAASVFAAVFNLEAKLLNHSSWYFCSKFVLRVNDKYVVIPDPLKLVTKLGRSDLVNWEHVEEYRVSLNDLCTILNDLCIVAALNDALSDRYPSEVGDHTVLITNILGLLKSPDNFRKLYFTLPSDKLCMDPKRPKLD